MAGNGMNTSSAIFILVAICKDFASTLYYTDRSKMEWSRHKIGRDNSLSVFFSGPYNIGTDLVGK
jgi:hypothetical protein